MNAKELLKHMATGSTGSTRQIGLRLRCSPHNLARYMRALAADELVEPHGTVRMPRSNVTAVVWRVTEKGIQKAAIKRDVFVPASTDGRLPK